MQRRQFIPHGAIRVGSVKLVFKIAISYAKPRLDAYSHETGQLLYILHFTMYQTCQADVC